MSDTCASCDHPLDGPYCSRCGEQRRDPRELTVWHFLTRTVLPELVDLDAKIWRTLRLLLFRPAFLAIEYAAGRRRPYVKPVRVLLTAIVLYAIATQSGLQITLNVQSIKLSLAPAPIPTARSIEGTLDHIDRFEILERMFRERIGPVDAATGDVRERFNRTLGAFATTLSFTSVALLALALYACFHQPRPLLVEHAVFSMHYFSFVLLSSLLGVVWIKLDLVTTFAITVVCVGVLLVWQFTYLALALRRFYFPDRRRLLAWPLAAALSVLIYFLNSLFVTVVQLAAGAIAIAEL